MRHGLLYSRDASGSLSLQPLWREVNLEEPGASGTIDLTGGRCTPWLPYHCRYVEDCAIMARGFIRAEVVAHEELLAAGSLGEASCASKARTMWSTMAT